MSELKAYKMVDEKYCTDCLCVIPSEVYLKSEADAVIKELKDKLRHYPMMVALLESDKKKISELEDKLQAANEQIENLINSASSITLFQDRVLAEKFKEEAK